MGVVFAVLAGYYYWSPKITGYMYNELLAKIHFWSFFISVNITFFPMHFLGLAGMPRRIADYPDSFGPWNFIASIGSFFSLITLFLFLYIVYKQLSDKIIFNNWSYPIFFFKDKIYFVYSLEWLLDNPPKFHNFNETPLC